MSSDTKPAVACECRYCGGKGIKEIHVHGATKHYSCSGVRTRYIGLYGDFPFAVEPMSEDQARAGQKEGGR